MAITPQRGMSYSHEDKRRQAKASLCTTVQISFLPQMQSFSPFHIMSHINQRPRMPATRNELHKLSCGQMSMHLFSISRFHRWELWGTGWRILRFCLATLPLQNSITSKVDIKGKSFLFPSTDQRAISMGSFLPRQNLAHKPEKPLSPNQAKAGSDSSALEVGVQVGRAITRQARARPGPAWVWHCALSTLVPCAELLNATNEGTLADESFTGLLVITPFGALKLQSPFTDKVQLILTTPQ